MSKRKFHFFRNKTTAMMTKQQKVCYWAGRLGIDTIAVVVAANVFNFSAIYRNVKILASDSDQELESIWKTRGKEKSLEETIQEADISDEEGLDSLVQALRTKAQSFAEENDCEFVKAHFVRVVDGDTIIVEMDSEEYTVRLIGVNTPESVASEEYLEATGKENTAEGVYASEFLKSLMEGRDDVYLMKDVSETDKYGRLLRYVWLDMPSDSMDINEISTKMLNAILLENGVAEVATYEPDVMYSKTFESLVERE